MKTFKSIIDFQNEFSTEEKCREYLETQRWGLSPACPFCGSVNVHRFPNNRIFKCREKLCRSKFSVTVGTVYENTKIPLTKWFLATYILSVHSKGISSLQLANWLGITQKSAWHLNHRIREMFGDNASELLEGIVEVDETYVGGKESNKHKSKKAIKNGAGKKAMVLGAVERDGRVKVKVLDQTDSETLGATVESFVSSDSILVTDESHAYKKVGQKYNHKKINHRDKEYVRREDISVYCNESAFRYNNRKALTL